MDHKNSIGHLMIAPSTKHNSSTHSDGNSDSDWDDDDDFGAKKINIKIKPIGQVTSSKISASVDELRATVGTWKSLGNINLTKPNSRRLNQSTVQLNNVDNEPKRPSSILNPTMGINSLIMPESMVFAPSTQTSNGLIYYNNTCDFNRQQQHLYTVNLGGVSNSDNSSDPMLVMNHLAPQPTVPRDIGEYIGLDSPIIENKNPNGLLKSSSLLSPGLFSAFRRVSTSDNPVLPVAFAIQECLNANLQDNSNLNELASIIGTIKMSVPQHIVDMELPQSKKNLDVTFVSSLGVDKVRLNDEFVKETENNELSQSSTNSSVTSKRLSINMEVVQDYAKKLNQMQTTTKYFLLPELLKYSIRSQEQKNELPQEITSSRVINPLEIISHWLCDLTATKVRIDIQLSDALKDAGLSTNDIKNLKLSMHINGEVISYQSKPDANWNSLDSKLTWSFTSLTELIQKSTLKGVTSCLARFNLSGGPSTPSEISIQFSVAGKTISGSHLKVNDLDNFRLATEKHEVRTGTFKCQPSCL